MAVDPSRGGQREITRSRYSQVQVTLRRARGSRWWEGGMMGGSGYAGERR